MAKISLRPLDDRVVVQPSEAEETTAGGIVLPDSAKENHSAEQLLPLALANCWTAVTEAK